MKQNNIAHLWRPPRKAANSVEDVKLAHCREFRRPPVPRRIYYATVIPISIELLPQTNKTPKTPVKPAKLFAIINEARGEVDLRTLDAIAYTTYRPDKKELCIEIQFIASDWSVAMTRGRESSRLSGHRFIIRFWIWQTKHRASIYGNWETIGVSGLLLLRDFI